VRRGGEAWNFYLVVLFGVEWPALLLGAVGAAYSLWRPTLLRAFLIWGFLLSLIIYSWAGEKFAWLVLHPLLPLLLLAGIGVQVIWNARRRWYGVVGAVVVVAGFAYSAYASYLVNAVNRADPRELLVSTQSSEDVKRVADEVVARAERDPETRITVDSSEGATFPWAWYFRHLPVSYLELGVGSQAELPDDDVLILTQAANDRLAPQGYESRQFPFRVWWVRDYGAMSPRAWWRWFTKREPWNPTGGMPEWLHIR
jgi:predicted membrane-bound mannosyltransferase